MTNPIRLLMVGDIVGEPGLALLTSELPRLRAELEAGFVVVNGENVYDGKGIRPSDATEIFQAGADVITTGNHVWERWQSKEVLTRHRTVLRPANYPRDNVGHGSVVVTSSENVRIGVINVQGRTFMNSIDCPFRTVDRILERMATEADVILVDFHAEATAEKMAMGWYLDGRVTAVVGTHTHVQTNDARVLPGGTAFITDVGMTGPYDSVIGMNKDIAIKRFLTQTPHKFELASGDVRLSAVLVEADATTGRAAAIETIATPEFARSVVRTAD